MFEAFRDFLRSIGEGGHPAAGPRGADDPRIAAAALLVHVGEADGTLSSDELSRLKAVLAAEFSLGLSEVEAVVAAGREADHEAVDLFTFTNVLKGALDEPARIRFIELLWEVSFADGEVHELEDNTVWRVAELLGVSTRERMLMKKAAASRSGL